MKEYSGYDTKINGQLEEDLRRSKDENTLYVSHYYFALNDGQYLIFYYNPQHFWDKITLEKAEDYVFENLRQECAVFKYFNPDQIFHKKALEDWETHQAFFPETPKIGNHYSSLGNKIISHHRWFYFLGGFGEAACLKRKSKYLNIEAVQILLQFAVMTKTPNYIKSIFDLKCFRKPMT